MSQNSRTASSNRGERSLRSRTPSVSGAEDVEAEGQLPPAAVAAWLKYREEGELDWTRRWVRITDETFDMHLSRGDPAPLHSFRLSELLIGTVGGRAFRLLHGDTSLEYRCCDDIEYDEVIAALLARARREDDGPDWQAMYAESLERQKELEGQLKKERAANEHSKREKLRLEAELADSRDLPALHQRQLDSAARQHRQALDDLKRDNLRLETDLGQANLQAKTDRLEIQELERKLEAAQEARERHAEDHRHRVAALEDELACVGRRLNRYLDSVPTEHVGVQCSLGKELENEWKKMYRRIVPTSDVAVGYAFAPRSGSSGCQTSISGPILSKSDADLMVRRVPSTAAETQTSMSGDAVALGAATSWFEFAALSAKVDQALADLVPTTPRDVSHEEMGRQTSTGRVVPSERSGTSRTSRLPPVPDRRGRVPSTASSSASETKSKSRSGSGTDISACLPGLSAPDLEDGKLRAAALLQLERSPKPDIARLPPDLFRHVESFHSRAQELSILTAEREARRHRGEAVDVQALNRALGELQACERLFRFTAVNDHGTGPTPNPSTTTTNDASGRLTDGGQKEVAAQLDPARRWLRLAEDLRHALGADRFTAIAEQLSQASEAGLDPTTAGLGRQFCELRRALLSTIATEESAALRVSDWETRVQRALVRLAENTALLDNPSEPLDVAAKHVERIAPELTALCAGLIAEEPWSEHPLANQLCNAMAEMFATFYLRLQRDTRDFLRHHRAADSIARFALALKRAGQILQPIKGCEMFAGEFQANWPIVAELVEMPRRVVLEDTHFAKLRAWIGLQDHKRRVRLYRP